MVRQSEWAWAWLGLSSYHHQEKVVEAFIVVLTAHVLYTGSESIGPNIRNSLAFFFSAEHMAYHADCHRATCKRDCLLDKAAAEIRH